MAPTILDLSGVSTLEELNSRLCLSSDERSRKQLEEAIATLPQEAKEYASLALYMSLNPDQTDTLKAFINGPPLIRNEVSKVLKAFKKGFQESPSKEREAREVQPVFGHEKLPSIAKQTMTWLDEMHFEGHGLREALKADLASFGVAMNPDAATTSARKYYFPASLNMETEEFGPECTGVAHIPDIHRNTVAWMEAELGEDEQSLKAANQASGETEQQQGNTTDRITKVPLEHARARMVKYLTLRFASHTNEIRSAKSIDRLVWFVETLFQMLTYTHYKGRIGIDTDIPRSITSVYKERSVEGIEFFDSNVTMMMEAGMFRGMTMKLSAEVLTHAIAEALFGIAKMEGDPMTLDLNEAYDRILENKGNWSTIPGLTEEQSRALIERWLDMYPLPMLMEPFWAAVERVINAKKEQ